jgi:hypothetical protein
MVDSICLSCFLTAAKAANEADLRGLETAHQYNKSRYDGESSKREVEEAFALLDAIDDQK